MGTVASGTGRCETVASTHIAGMAEWNVLRTILGITSTRNSIAFDKGSRKPKRYSECRRSLIFWSNGHLQVPHSRLGSDDAFPSDIVGTVVGIGRTRRTLVMVLRGATRLATTIIAIVGIDTTNG